MPEEKNYINGMIIKEKIFDNGGKHLKISIKVEELIEQLRAIEKDGWVNLIQTRRKEPSDKGVTHYTYEDTWEPNSEYKTNQTQSPQPSDGNDDGDDLPF